MIAEELIPTPFPRPRREKQRIPLVSKIDTRWRSLSTVYRLTLLVLRLIVLFISGRATGDRVGAVTKRTLERLGFLWIKAGQLLSLRADLFSEAFCRHMAELQHAVVGFPVATARAILTKELGDPPEVLFGAYSEEPFAAGSIAQVHRATLIDGTQVVVKIMRPGAEKVFAKDLAFLKWLVRWVERLGILSFIRWSEATWELEQMMKEEVDYRHEQTNLAVMREQLRPHGVLVPQVFERYCSRRVLVMEFIPGPLMSDYIAAGATDPRAVEEWCTENEIDPPAVGIKLYKSFLRQLLEDNRFHGDLHPGNIILLRSNHVALIDFGTVGSVERDLLRRYVLIIRAIAEYDLQKACDLVLSLVPEYPPVDLDELREEMVRSLRAWVAQSSVKSLAYHEKAMTDAVINLARIMAKERLMITWGFLKIDRTWGTLDASMSALVPDIDYPRLFREFFEERALRILYSFDRPSTWLNALASVHDFAAEYKLFIEPQIRRFGRQFVGMTSVADNAMGVFFSLLRMGSVAFLFLLGVVLAGRYSAPAAAFAQSLGAIDLMQPLHLSGLSTEGLWILFGCDLYFLWRIRGVFRAAKIASSTPG